MCLGTASHRNWRNMPHTENRQQHNRDGENLTKIDYQNKRRVDWKEWNLMRMFGWLVPARRVVLRSVYLHRLAVWLNLNLQRWVGCQKGTQPPPHKLPQHTILVHASIQMSSRREMYSSGSSCSDRRRRPGWGNVTSFADIFGTNSWKSLMNW